MNTSLQTTDSAALASNQGIIFQEIVALEKCYEMKEGDTIWIEKDGDVSKVGADREGSSQTEVKHYDENEPLTDHHKNFWNTLKNWMSERFNHSRYSLLILHTTQKFGSNSKFNGWNEFGVEKRLEIILEIINSRSIEEFQKPISGSVAALQKQIKESDHLILTEVLAKVIIYTEKENLEELKEKIIREKLRDIPQANQIAYLEGLIGFVINSSTNSNGWSITNEEFTAKCHELGSMYKSQEFTFPEFDPKPVDLETQAKHIDHEFVRKIIDIQHDKKIPKAISVWLELHKSLAEELDGYTTFREKTNKYRNDLIYRLETDYSRRSRRINDTIMDSKDFYDETIMEISMPMTPTFTPPLQFKNGLIHDAMDSNDDLKWRLQNEESD